MSRSGAASESSSVWTLAPCLTDHSAAVLRRFERELEALKKEMAHMSSAPSPATSATSTASSTAHSLASSTASQGSGGEVTQRPGGRSSQGNGQDEGKPPLATDAALLNSPLALGESRALPSASAVAVEVQATSTPSGGSAEIGGGETA